MTKEEFINECAFAKVVETTHGSALLIAGQVIEVKGPANLSYEDHACHAEWLAEALRKGRRPMSLHEQCAQGQMANQMLNTYVGSHSQTATFGAYGTE